MSKKLQAEFLYEAVNIAYNTPIENLLEIEKAEKKGCDYYFYDYVYEILDNHKKHKKFNKEFVKNENNFITKVECAIMSIYDSRLKAYKHQKALERKEQRNADKNKCK